MAAKPKLTREQVEVALRGGQSARALARQFGVRPAAIDKIRAGLTHKQIFRDVRAA